MQKHDIPSPGEPWHLLKQMPLLLLACYVQGKSRYFPVELDLKKIKKMNKSVSVNAVCLSTFNQDFLLVQSPFLVNKIHLS